MAAGPFIAYTGESLDRVTNAYALGNGYRWYLPGSMRFNAPDQSSPFGRGGINPYCYCEADPINHRDPSGRTPITEMLEIGGIRGMADSPSAEDLEVAGYLKDGKIQSPSPTSSKSPDMDAADPSPTHGPLAAHRAASASPVARGPTRSSYLATPTRMSPEIVPMAESPLPYDVSDWYHTDSQIPTYEEVLQKSEALRHTISNDELGKYFAPSGSDFHKRLRQRRLVAFVKVIKEHRITAPALKNFPNSEKFSIDLGYESLFINKLVSRLRKNEIGPDRRAGVEELLRTLGAIQ